MGQRQPQGEEIGAGRGRRVGEILAEGGEFISLCAVRESRSLRLPFTSPAIIHEGGVIIWNSDATYKLGGFRHLVGRRLLDLVASESLSTMREALKSTASVPRRVQVRSAGEKKLWVIGQGSDIKFKGRSMRFVRLRLAKTPGA